MMIEGLSLIVLFVVVLAFCGAVAGFFLLRERKRLGLEDVCERPVEPADDEPLSFRLTGRDIASVVVFAAACAGTVFLYPWAVAFSDAMSLGGFWVFVAEGLFFVFIFGLLFAVSWRSGVFGQHD